MELNKIAFEKFNKYMAQAQAGTRQVSSGPASPVAAFCRMSPLGCFWASAIGQRPAQAAAPVGSGDLWLKKSKEKGEAISGQAADVKTLISALAHASAWQQGLGGRWA